MEKKKRKKEYEKTGICTKENIEGLLKSTKYLKTSEAGFDLFEISNKADGSVDVKKVTSNGFGDRFNHGIRIFERTNDYWVIGTANPFNGTQLWRTKSEQIQPETGESKPEENKPDVTIPESKPETNAPETKPETSKPETGTPETKPESKPETGRPNTKPEIKPEMKPEIPNNNMIFQFIGQMMKKVQDFFSGWTQWGFRF